MTLVCAQTIGLTPVLETNAVRLKDLVFQNPMGLGGGGQADNARVAFFCGGRNETVVGSRKCFAHQTEQ